MIETVVQYVGGATFLLFVGALKILVDPILVPKGTIYNFGEAGNSTRLFQPAYKDGDFKETDFLLLTHAHSDHIDTPGLNAINNNTEICVCHDSVLPFISGYEFGNITNLRDQQVVSFTINEYQVTIEAIIVIHALDDAVAQQIGYGNGYYLTIFDTKSEQENRIYITGDTMPKGLVYSQLENKTIDLMIPNIGGAFNDQFYGPITLTSTYLKEMMQILKPTFVCPVHFNEFSHYQENVTEVIKLGDPKIIIPERGEKTKFFTNNTPTSYGFGFTLIFFTILFCNF